MTQVIISCQLFPYLLLVCTHQISNLQQCFASLTPSAVKRNNGMFLSIVFSCKISIALYLLSMLQSFGSKVLNKTVT